MRLYTEGDGTAALKQGSGWSRIVAMPASLAGTRVLQKLFRGISVGDGMG